jgi:hypothetical protein
MNMKAHHLVTLAVLGFGFVACAGSNASDPASAEFVQEDSLAASSQTTAATGITSWELQKSDVGARAIGRSIDGALLADLTTTRDTHVCAEGAGEAVTTIATLPARGKLTVGCGGKVVSDSFDAPTRAIADLLLNDLAQASTPLPPETDEVASVTEALEYCVPHTNTKCTGAVYWCKNTYQDCSSDTWHPCGVCFGWKW